MSCAFRPVVAPICASWSPLVAKMRSEEHTSELQSRLHLVCRLLLEKKKHARAVDRFRLYRTRLPAGPVRIDSRLATDGPAVALGGQDVEVRRLRAEGEWNPGTDRVS